MKKRVMVTCATVFGPEKVPAERLIGRVWAVHRSLNTGGAWTLTHRPAGRIVMMGDSRAALIEAAACLPPRWRERARHAAGVSKDGKPLWPAPAGIKAARRIVETDGGRSA